MSQPDETTEEIRAQIQAMSIPASAVVLVKLGNDQYPVFDNEAARRAREILEPILRQVTNAPIIFWNHAIEIQSIHTPGMGVTPITEPGDVVIVDLPSRANRSINLEENNSGEVPP